MMGTVGALVTLNLPDDSPVLDMPWIITFGPLSDDEEWEPVVCGPYEHAHALALAESVVADEELMAVVEPLMPRTSAAEIRAEIDAAREAAEEMAAAGEFGEEEIEVAEAGEEGGAEAAGAGQAGVGTVEPSAPPTPEEIRAGFARIADRLTRAS